MDNEILLSMKEISLDGIIIAAIVFGLTMLIKWPIKRLTAKFDENIRKAINTVIVFIPMLLALLLSMLYFGIFKAQWFTNQMFNSMATSYVLSVALYALYSRIVILIKGVKVENKNDLSKETLSYIKENAKAISKALKLDEQKLNAIVSQVENLVRLKDAITSNVIQQNIPEAERLDSQIKELNAQKNYYIDKITKSQAKLEGLQKSIKKEND